MNWTELLNERQNKEIELALIYQEQLAAFGTDGHNLRTTLYRLVSILNAMEEGTEIATEDGRTTCFVTDDGEMYWEETHPSIVVSEAVTPLLAKVDATEYPYSTKDIQELWDAAELKGMTIDQQKEFHNDLLTYGFATGRTINDLHRIMEYARQLILHPRVNLNNIRSFESVGINIRPFIEVLSTWDKMKTGRSFGVLFVDNTYSALETFQGMWNWMKTFK